MRKLAVKIKPDRKGGYNVFVKFPNHWFWNSHHTDRRKADRERARLLKRFRPTAPDHPRGFQWDQ